MRPGPDPGLGLCRAAFSTLQLAAGLARAACPTLGRRGQFPQGQPGSKVGLTNSTCPLSG